MSKTYRVAFIGTGLRYKQEGSTGFGMSHLHAAGYNATGRCEIVATCDLIEERAQKFNEEHAGGKAAVYTDYQKMLAEVKPDIVSIATWPDSHAALTIATAKSGVKAIHCEKPVATTMGDAREMVRVCEENGVQLTFNHQRRFIKTFQKARELVKEGAIGELKRMEGACDNFNDWGTHWFNMFFYYNDESPAQWVMAQIDARKPRFVFAVQHETQGICTVRYENGVTGALWVGEFANDIVGCMNRLIGTEGTIELSWSAPNLRIRGKGDGEFRNLDDVPGESTPDGGLAINRVIADNIEALDNGTKPLLDASNGLASAELTFACYESARRRARIDLPLTIDDSPLDALVRLGIYPDAVKK